MLKSRHCEICTSICAAKPEDAAIKKNRSQNFRSWLAAFTLLLIPQSVQATLYVIILDRQEIAIASDGKRIGYIQGKLSPVSRTTEKVTKLGAKLAFMCSGLVEITTAKATIRPSEIARVVYAKHVDTCSLARSARKGRWNAAD